MGWHILCAEEKKKNGDYQTRILHPAKLSFKNEREIKIFPNKRKMKAKGMCITEAAL